MLVPGAGAGLSPRRATHFLLLRQKKVSKEKATPSLRPLRCATGQTCVGAVAGCAAELTALRSSFVQTAAASQMTKLARCDARATPQPPRRRRSHRGGVKQPNSRTGHRYARPGLRSARRLRPRDGAERSNGPNGCPLPHPLCVRRGAQRRGRRQRGRFLFGDFLSAGDPVARQEKVTAPPGALPGSRTWNKHAAQSAHRQVIWDRPLSGL